MHALSKYGVTRRDFLKLSGTAGATALLAACSTAAPSGSSDGAAGGGRPIKIGLVGPITGPIAAFGEADEFTLDQVREIFADGIDTGGTVHPVEIILKDAESDSSRAAPVAQDLILNEEVDLLMAHVFSINWTSFMIFIVVIGGIGTMEGPIIGTVIFFLLREYMSDFGEWSFIILGSIAVVMMLIAPQAVWGLIKARFKWEIFPLRRQISAGLLGQVGK